MRAPVWNTHSPATLLHCAPKLIPQKAVPSMSSKTASGALFVSLARIWGAAMGGAGTPLGV